MLNVHLDRVKCDVHFPSARFAACLGSLPIKSLWEEIQRTKTHLILQLLHYNRSQSHGHVILLVTFSLHHRSTFRTNNLIWQSGKLPPCRHDRKLLATWWLGERITWLQCKSWIYLSFASSNRIMYIWYVSLCLGTTIYTDWASQRFQLTLCVHCTHLLHQKNIKSIGRWWPAEAPNSPCEVRFIRSIMRNQLMRVPYFTRRCKECRAYRVGKYGRLLRQDSIAQRVVFWEQEGGRGGGG